MAVGSPFDELGLGVEALDTGVGLAARPVIEDGEAPGLTARGQLATVRHRHGLPRRLPVGACGWSCALVQPCRLGKLCEERTPPQPVPFGR